MFKKFTALRQLAHRFLALTLTAATLGAATIKPAMADPYFSHWPPYTDKQTLWYSVIDPSYKGAHQDAEVSLRRWKQGMLLPPSPPKCTKSPQLGYLGYGRVARFVYKKSLFFPLDTPSPFPGKKRYERIFIYRFMFLEKKITGTSIYIPIGEPSYTNEYNQYRFTYGEIRKSCGVADF